MKKYLIILAFVLAIPFSTQAATFGLNQEYSLRQGESVKSDLYAAGGTATLVGNVTGDVFMAGGNVFVGSTIGKSVNLIGGTVDVIATISDSLRIVSGKSLVRSSIGKDLIIASGNLQILSQTMVSGDVSLATGAAILDGEIKGDVRGVAGTLTINGIVRGDVNVTADKVAIGPNAEIDGELRYASSKEATIADGAVIKGEKTFTLVDTRSRAERLLPTLWGTWIFIKFLILLVSALILQGVFQSISNTLVHTAIVYPGWSIVRGFLVLVAVPFALLLVFLTFVGIPFFVLGTAAYTLFLVLAYLFSPIVLGAIIFKFTQKSHLPTVNWKSIVVGVSGFMILTPLNWFGTALQSALFLLTLGAIYHVLFERFLRARE
jgi:cytoskeletal protein CcmA (bactofilin family)